MIPAKKTIHETLHGNHNSRLGRVTACLILGMLISVFSIDATVQANDSLAVKERLNRDSRDDKVKPRRRRKHRSRRREQTPAADNSEIRLLLRGSFELDLGSGNIIRGEGSTTVELNPIVVEKLLASPSQSNPNEPSPSLDWAQMILTLPKTIETTAEVLKRISDPQTQANLRQVEQLLRLLPQGPAES